MSALGLIPRPYEITPPRRTKDEFNAWEAEQPTKYMKPDADGCLMVVADCDTHFTSLPADQIGIAQSIPCPKGCGG
jgi:hypothetical protein